MRHPNIVAYLNQMHGRKQIAEQFTFNEVLIAALAKHYSPEGWAELLAVAAAETDKLWGKPKDLTAGEAYRLTLQPKARVREAGL